MVVIVAVAARGRPLVAARGRRSSVVAADGFLALDLDSVVAEKIPNAFLDHLSRKIPKKVFLRNHLGDLWPVEVAETEDGLFFQEGWSKLVSDNSLQVGDFLVFKYSEDDMIDILVLGTSGCEKGQVGRSGRTTTPARQEKEKNMLHEEAGQEEEIEVMGQPGNSAGKKKLGGRGENYSVSGYHAEKLKRGIKEFLPSNNPFFITKMRKSRRGELSIPHDIREDFDLKFSDSIKLQDPKGKLWTGKVVSWKDGRVWVRDGWKKLCRWNKVSEQDTLICEFMPSSKRTCEIIRVQIIGSGI